MLDGDHWVKLSKAHARRRKKLIERGPSPAGEISIAAQRELDLELQELDDRRAALERGGAAKRGKTKCPRIYEWLLDQLRADPEATNAELAARFPKDELKLYRSGGSFVEDGVGRLSIHGLNRQITRARRELGLARKPPSRGT